MTNILMVTEYAHNSTKRHQMRPFGTLLLCTFVVSRPNIGQWVIANGVAHALES